MSKLSSSKTQELLHASAIPITPGASTLDANGIQLFEWSHPLKDRSDYCGEASETRYVWCGCFALAQIESRMGIASFNSAVAIYGGVMVVAAVIGSLTPWYIFHFSDASLYRSLIWCAVEFVFLCAVTTWWVHRAAKARTQVRERFQIPGTEKEDCNVACCQSTRMIRQMVRHLNCEHAGTFGRVDTLPAYTQ